MSANVVRDIPYIHDGTNMLGLLVAQESSPSASTILLFHDAFGLGSMAIEWAHVYAELGYTVVAADVWGERTTAGSEGEIGPLIGSMVSDRERWLARAAAALEAARQQPEVDSRKVVAVGYCFGGSTALELLRNGGDLRGVVSIHGGFDLLEKGWSAANPSASVLLCTGADDPMATRAQRDTLTGELDEAGLDWELDVYSDTRHAFTSPDATRSPRPDIIAYNPRSARRAWRSTQAFLAEILDGDPPTS